MWRTDGPTDWHTDLATDTARCWVACPRLKIERIFPKSKLIGSWCFNWLKLPKMENLAQNELVCTKWASWLKWAKILNSDILKNEQWGPNECHINKRYFYKNEQLGFEWASLLSSLSTENELFHPNNTNGKKNLDAADPSVVKGEQGRIHGYPRSVLVGWGSNE